MIPDMHLLIKPGLENMQTVPLNILQDKARDNTHPGPETHKQWAIKIKKQFNL